MAIIKRKNLQARRDAPLLMEAVYPAPNPENWPKTFKRIAEESMKDFETSVKKNDMIAFIESYGSYQVALFVFENLLVNSERQDLMELKDELQSVAHQALEYWETQGKPRLPVLAR